MSTQHVDLEPNALYICLTQLFTPGFHWSLFFTSPTDGCVTRYEWAEVKGITDLTLPVESFQQKWFESVEAYDEGLRFNLAYLKVLGYTPPVEGVPPVEIFEGLVIPPEVYVNVRDNRRNGISC